MRTLMLDFPTFFATPKVNRLERPVIDHYVVHLAYFIFQNSQQYLSSFFIFSEEDS